MIRTNTVPNRRLCFGAMVAPRYGDGTEMAERYAWQDASGAVARYITDNVVGVRELAQTSGAVLDTMNYDAFGTPTDSDAGNRFKFTGRECDAVTGQYYYRARNYAPDVGRFTSQDPLGFAAGDANLHRYVSNSPADATDRTGLFVDYWPRQPGSGPSPLPSILPSPDSPPDRGKIIIEGPLPWILPPGLVPPLTIPEPDPKPILVPTPWPNDLTTPPSESWWGGGPPAPPNVFPDISWIKVNGGKIKVTIRNRDGTEKSIIEIDVTPPTPKNPIPNPKPKGGGITIIIGPTTPGRPNIENPNQEPKPPSPNP